MAGQLSNTDFTRLLTAASKAARKHHVLVTKVAEECIARHGCTYSDVDEDGIIDVLDCFGSDKFTATEFDKLMTHALSINTKQT